MRRGPITREGFSYRRSRNAITAFNRLKRRRWHGHRSESNLRHVRTCEHCDGAVVHCTICKRTHCDDDCRPLSCIEKEQRDEQRGTP